MRKGLMITLGTSLAGLLCSLAVWSEVPAMMPIHWNIHGVADGFAPRWVGLTMMPVIAGLVNTFVYMIIARGQKKVSATVSKKVVSVIVGSSSLFMLGVHLLMIRAALHAEFNMDLSILMTMLGGLFLGMAWVMPKVQQNPWVGIRTPWAMKDEVNWKLTHDFAYRSMGLGALTVLAVSWILPLPAMMWVSLTALLGGSLAPVLFSYVIHRMRR